LNCDGKDDQVLNGYKIAMSQVDLHGIIANTIQASQASSNQILFEMPSVSQGLHTEGAFGVACKRIEQAHDITKKTRVNDTSKDVNPFFIGKKFLLLNFPEDEVLDPLPFLTQVLDPEETSQEGDTEIDYMLYTHKFTYNIQ
jgi:hypothetical protein